MNLKYYLDKISKKIRYDFLFGLNKLKKDSLIKLKFAEAQHPVYLRKNTSDTATFKQIFYHNSYNINLNFEPKVIFDCGANVGLASVYFKNRYPNAKIIAVEPASSNYEMLVKNTANYKDITCIKAGIWKRSANLRVVDSGQGEWGFVTEEVENATPDTINAISIDELMRMHGVDHIDVLKIDIESSEKELFEENFENWLPKSKVVLIELHDNMKEGCSRSFFKAMVNYKFTMNYNGENVICEML